MAGNQGRRIAIVCEELPRTRKEAIAIGSRHYFTGVECRNGHKEPRLVSCCACLGCSRENVRKYAKENPDKVAKSTKEYISRNPDKRREWKRQYRLRNIEKAREKRRKEYWSNPEAAREAAKKWAKDNKERHIEGVRKWAKENPDKRSSYVQNARARRKLAEGSHTGDDLIRIRKMQKDKCGYCGKKLRGGGHLDHIIALSKGGSNAPSNLQWLCGPCNLSKHARDPIEFAQSLGRLL